MASTYLTRTIGTTGNRKTFTYSTWIKRGNIGSYQPFMGDVTDAGNDYFTVYFENPDKLQIYSQLGGPTVIHLSTNREFRDTSAWYHIVIATDTTQATASDRVKIYVNGVQETSFSVATYPNQNTDLAINISGETQEVGAGHTLSSYTFDGSMSHVHFIDGTAYDATAFGEYDANGVWTINTSPSVTYGTNGFFILKDGNSVTDQSPNTNNFTVGGGTLTNTLDCPDNVFATGNALIPSTTLTQGNLSISAGSSVNRTAFSTIAVSQGKWYFEMKPSASFGMIGITDISQAVYSNYPGQVSRGYGYNYNGQKYNNGSSSSFGATFGSGDIVGCAVDLDNNKIYFSKNGTWQNSGDPTSGATGTGSAFDLTDGYDYSLAFHAYNGSTTNGNFGNGYFGTTAVSSAGTNASGIGIFEYDVPTGFTSLSTKGLNL